MSQYKNIEFTLPDNFNRPSIGPDNIVSNQAEAGESYFNEDLNLAVTFSYMKVNRLLLSIIGKKTLLKNLENSYRYALSNKTSDFKIINEYELSVDNDSRSAFDASYCDKANERKISMRMSVIAFIEKGDYFSITLQYKDEDADNEAVKKAIADILSSIHYLG